MDADDEPLLGCELIRIGLETYSIELQFDRFVLEVGAPFHLTRPGYAALDFRPVEKQGHVNALWCLIAATIDSVAWPTDAVEKAEIRIRFSSGAEISIPPAGFPRGTLRGKGVHESGALIFEDF
jgi:hypothetical protein